MSDNYVASDDVTRNQHAGTSNSNFDPRVTFEKIKKTRSGRHKKCKVHDH
jgi:hypothetical protein